MNLITEEQIDAMIRNVARAAANCAIALERGLPANRIMAHLKRNVGDEVPTLIMDAVVEAKKSFDAKA